MADFGAHALASLYLGQYTPSFWRWTPSGDALVWTDGTTITFKAELEELLARLAHKGLPSLSAIALVLAACREGYEDAVALVEVELLSGVPAEQRDALATQLGHATDAMGRITALPVRLRSGVDAKAVLLETVLEDAPRRLDPEEAAAVVAALGEGAGPARPGGLVEWAPPSLYELAEDLGVIHAATRDLDAESLDRLRRSGVPDDLGPAEVELPDSERVRRLLASLHGDPELAGLARLARDLLATVQVPRAVSERDDQAVGGVSDVSNRGPLHRLLLSELAHDPLTFTVRIAMGEALYLRREAPPHAPPGKRVVVIDTGIRLWGVARLYAAAVGLALVASAGKAEVQVWRTEDERAEPVDLTTREGLAAHLQGLEASPQPGRALRGVLEELARAQDTDADVVLVTHPDALADSAFVAELERAPEHPLYAASVDAEGGYRLEVRSPRGRKVLGRAKLDLDVLLNQGSKRQPGRPLREPGGPGLPAILGADPFPLLLPARLDPARVASHPLHGILGATRDGRLLHWAWRRWDVGGRQLTAQVPQGTLHWLEIDDEGVARVCVHQVSSRSLIVISADLATGKVRRFSVGQTDRSLLCATRVGDLLALVHPWHIDALSLARGTLAEPLRLPDRLSWVQGRFFCGINEHGREWHALGRDGGTLRLEGVPLDPTEQVIALWDRWGHDGPWAFRRDGSVLCLADGSVPIRFQRDGVVGFHGVSRDGNRLVVQEPEGGRYLIDLEVPGSRRIYVSNYLRALQREPGVLAAKAPQLRRRFQAVGLDERGHLALISRRNRVVPLHLDARGDLLLGPGESEPARLAFLRPFGRMESPTGARYSLRTAVWPGGSKAILDSRGLLHLIPTRGPEVTLVLVDQGPLAAWTSDGVRTGRAYFWGRDHKDSGRVFAAVQQFVATVG